MTAQRLAVRANTAACMCDRFRAGYNLQQLMRVQQLVTALEPGSADGGGSQAAFLGAAARALVPAMLLERRNEELRELAALMGAPLFPCWAVGCTWEPLTQAPSCMHMPSTEVHAWGRPGHRLSAVAGQVAFAVHRL